jgi:histidyl-tRNA synthetase
VQCDADIFGLSSPLADAEVIALSLAIYQAIGFKEVKALINDRELMKNLPYEAIVSIDKLKKIGKQNVIEEMIKKGVSREQADTYLNQVLNLKPNETIKTILECLKNYGFPEAWFAFDPTIARSFAYSSGPIWEIEISGFESGSVLGGERFDGIVEKISGVKIPATGFGLGFDRTLEAAKQFGLIPNFKTSTKVLVTIFSPELQNNSYEITKNLREKEINTEIYTDVNAKLEKQLKYADRKGIPFAIIIGPEEVEKKTFTLKNLVNKSQKSYSSFEELIEEVKQN